MPKTPTPKRKPTRSTSGNPKSKMPARVKAQNKRNMKKTKGY